LWRWRRSMAQLPAVADSKALNDFLQIRKAADPDHFATSPLASSNLWSGE